MFIVKKKAMFYCVKEYNVFIMQKNVMCLPNKRMQRVYCVKEYNVLTVKNDVTCLLCTV